MIAEFYHTQHCHAHCPSYAPQWIFMGSMAMIGLAMFYGYRKMEEEEKMWEAAPPYSPPEESLEELLEVAEKTIEALRIEAYANQHINHEDEEFVMVTDEPGRLYPQSSRPIRQQAIVEN